MDIGTALVADGQATEAVQPGERALDHPAMLSQSFAGVDAFARYTAGDVSTPQGLPTPGNVVGLIGVQLLGPLAPSPVRLLNGRDGIQQIREDDRVVAVGATEDCGQRHPAAIGQDVPFGAGFATIGGVGTNVVAPLLAGMLAESTAARLQSICPASPRRSTSV